MHLGRRASATTVQRQKTRPDAGEFARTQFGFNPDLLQAKVLRSSAKRGILNCTRQWGKSTVAAIAALHRATVQPGSLVIVASPTERQSGEFLMKAGALSSQMGVRPRGDGKNALSLMLPNGSRIVGLPGTERTVRGFSAVSLLVIDEAARVPDEMYKALRPMLAVAGGDLWLLSTPNGKRGFFYENWANGDDQEVDNGHAGWERISVPATQCPRIPESFLEEERRQLGSQWFRQEYLCEFTQDDCQMFPRELIRGALDDLEPLEFARR